MYTSISTWGSYPTVGWTLWGGGLFRSRYELAVGEVLGMGIHAKRLGNTGLEVSKIYLLTLMIAGYNILFNIEMPPKKQTSCEKNCLNPIDVLLHMGADLTLKFKITEIKEFSFFWHEYWSNFF